MSKLNRIKGDLLALATRGKFDIIVHGCNCFNTMGSGIARQIREQFPDAYDADTAYGAAGDYNKLGNYSFANVMANGHLITIINAYTQFDFNRAGSKNDVFEYTSFLMILEKLKHHAPTMKFGFPMIGMGLAGGNEALIIRMLEDFAEDIAVKGGTVTLVEYSPV